MASRAVRQGVRATAVQPARNPRGPLRPAGRTCGGLGRPSGALLPAALLAALLGLAGSASDAQAAPAPAPGLAPSLPDGSAIIPGSTPAAIDPSSWRPGGSRCPLIVKPVNAVFQPLPIKPSQVAAKARAGCLSPGDAIYGPDGCPIRFCGDSGGVIGLPAPQPRPAAQPPAP